MKKLLARGAFRFAFLLHKHVVDRIYWATDSTLYPDERTPEHKERSRRKHEARVLDYAAEQLEEAHHVSVMVTEPQAAWKIWTPQENKSSASATPPGITVRYIHGPALAADLRRVLTECYPEYKQLRDRIST